MNNKPRTGWEASFSLDPHDDDHDLQAFRDIDLEWDDYEEKYGDPE